MKALFAVLLAVLLFGCASKPAQSEAPVNDSTKPSEPGKAPPPAIPPQNKTVPAQPPPEAASPYAGKDFPSLVSLGLPLECDITYTYSGKPGTSKVYLKGGSELRVETVGGAGMSQCSKTVSIVRKDKVFVGCDGKMIMPSCDWFGSDYDPALPGESSTFNFRETPPSQISCRDWAYDQSKFVTGGNVCHLGG
ncbi:MAG: hypothetical protein U0R44_04775 [Candidatus Micrarchaeia archaeon]